MQTTSKLVAAHGLPAVTMSQIAAAAGIGRATLYKYFPDVESILIAWHEEHVGAHLSQLAAARDDADDAMGRLEAVLQTYGLICQQRPNGTEIAALMHDGSHVMKAQQQLHGLVTDLIAGAAKDGYVRRDVAALELATYCLSALGAASTLSSPEAVHRLVTVTIQGLKEP